MKAMILAAGLGTRLRPLTDNRPKALVEINGRTLLEITLSRLRSFGVSEVIINVHHFADMVNGYLKSKNNFGMRIEISREDGLLLDTGGGLKKAAWFFLEHSQRTTKKKPSSVIPSAGDERRSRVPTPVGRNPSKASTRPNSDQKPDASGNADEPFLLHNVDVISTIDLRRMLQFHIEHHALATLAVQSRESSRLLLFNDQLQLRGRRISGHDTVASTLGSTQTEEEVTSGEWRVASEKKKQIPRYARNDQHPFAFSGIHVISPRFLPMLTERDPFSIIDAYLRLAAQGEKILAFRADEYYWRDLGRPADLSQAAADLENGLLAERGHSL